MLQNGAGYGCPPLGDGELSLPALLLLSAGPRGRADQLLKRWKLLGSLQRGAVPDGPRPFSMLSLERPDLAVDQQVRRAGCLPPEASWIEAELGPDF